MKNEEIIKKLEAIYWKTYDFEIEEEIQKLIEELKNGSLER